MHKPDKPMIKIVWRDAIYRSKVKASPEEAIKKGNLITVTQTGFFLGKDNDKVLIGWQHDDLDGQYRHILSIPKEAVIKISKLEDGEDIE